MKDFISTNYTFTPGISGVGTVSLGVSDFDIKRLVSIINQTQGVVIYSTASTTAKYTAIDGSTLTLNVDTSTHSNTDVLQVIYNSPSEFSPISDLIMYLKQLVYYVGSSLGNVDALNRLKVRAEVVDAVTTVTTVTGVTTVSAVTAVTNITNLGGMPQTEFGINVALNTFANSIRDKITF
jgi:hypothetical protein